MVDPTSRRWRLARAGTFALLASWIAGLGHAAGGGGRPDLAVTLVAGTAVAGGLFLLTTRRLRPVELLLALLASQLLFHLLFALDPHATPAGLPVLGMVGFHLAAAAVTTVALAAAEAGLFGLAERVVRAVTRLLSALPVPDVPSAPGPRIVVLLPSAVAGGGPLAGRRGPPAATRLVAPASAPPEGRPVAS